MAITCRTCGKELTCYDDVLCCFEAEHELPNFDELPATYPTGEVTGKLYLAIIMCEMVRKGELQYVGGGRFTKGKRPIGSKLTSNMIQ